MKIWTDKIKRQFDKDEKIKESLATIFDYCRDHSDCDNCLFVKIYSEDDDCPIYELLEDMTREEKKTATNIIYVVEMNEGDTVQCGFSLKKEVAQKMAKEISESTGQDTWVTAYTEDEDSWCEFD